MTMLLVASSTSSPSMTWMLMLYARFLLLCPVPPTSSTVIGHSRIIFAHHGRPPPYAIPLGLCEGDCKDDTECQEGLFCFQQDPNEPIPGCIVAKRTQAGSTTARISAEERMRRPINASTPMQSNLRSTTRLRATAPSNPTSATRVLIDQNSLRLQDACIRTRVVLPPVRIPWDNARETANGTRIVAQECFAFSAIPTNPSRGASEATRIVLQRTIARTVHPWWHQCNLRRPTIFASKCTGTTTTGKKALIGSGVSNARTAARKTRSCFCITVRGIRRALTLSMLRQIKFRFGSSTRTCVWSDPAMQLL
jgi:hypothetical protein